MSVKSKDKNVPELRFPGFSGEWGEKRLGEVAVIASGYSCKQNADKKGLMVTRIETISDGTINLDKVGYVSDKKNISYYKLKIGDILFSNINSIKHIGKVAYIDKEYELYHGMNLLKISSNNIKAIYLFYLLRTRKLKNHFESVCNPAVSQASINQKELSNTRIIYPVLSEQQKIASFLSDIDLKIEKLSRKKELMEEYKKGMMQKIFSQEVRFKDDNGKNFPEWEEKRLGETDVILKRGPFGSSLKKSMFVNSLNKTYKVYEQKHAIKKDLSIGSYYITQKDFHKLKGFEVIEGDFIMSCSGTIGEIIKISGRFKPGIINQALLRIRLNKDFDEDFFMSAFRMNISQLETKGSGIKNLGSINYIKNEFVMPIPSMDEQHKISDILSGIYDKINYLDQKINKLEEFKKGMMQRMFV